jgi:pimeloyl-ACP methyl ester carboxylesterase
VPGCARSRIVVTAGAVFLLALPVLMAADGAVASHPTGPASYIVIGFTGGFVRHDNPHHGPVQLAQRIQTDVPKGTYIRVFENRHRKTAYKTILRLLDSDHDGFLSDAEKSRARIILFGHSWGASAVVLLARELDRAGVPVLLTVQVDSVAKLWQHDGVISDNVAQAVNFYQPHGLLHGRKVIRAADDSKTKILGNYRFDYRETPARCADTSWFYRTFTPSHMQSECDPHLWAEVESLVLQRLEPQPGMVAAISQQ